MADCGETSGKLTDQDQCVESGQMPDVNAAKISDTTVSTISDHTACDISGCAVLPDNKLVLVDFQNGKLKLFNLKASNITIQLKMTRQPWDVARITENQVAVTLLNARKIAFVKVTTLLQLDREMCVDGDCRTITHNDGKLYVAFSAPLKIEIISLDGSVERTIDCSQVFECPSHIAVSTGNDVIYVTDERRSCVKKMGMDGAVEAVYRDKQLKCPRGIIVDQQGRVIVCGANSHNIHLLAPDLTKIKLLVDKLRSPHSISLCNNTCRLYVGRSDDEISVYHLS